MPKMPSFFVGKFIFIKMDNYDNAIAYIEEQEATEISYVKIGNNSKNLIVSFASNGHGGFERKTSLMKLKFERNDFDVLYLRNKGKWYLGGLNGIGKNIKCTIAFLRRHFAKYDKVITIGNSAGGYASLLFGSLLKVNKVIAINAQTDLQYCVDNLPDDYGGRRNLINQSKNCPKSWSKYNKIANVMNDNVSFHVCYRKYMKNHCGYILHGDYQFDQIKECSFVKEFNRGKKEVIPLIEKFLEE